MKPVLDTRMATYQFRLTAIQKLRAAELDRQRARWAEACQAIEEIATRRATLERELDETRSLQRAANSGPQLDVGKLLAAKRYDGILAAQHRRLIDQEAMLTAEADQCRTALVEAQREVKTLEKLEMRQRAEHRTDQARVAVKEFDEAGLRRHGQNYEARQ